MAVNGTAKQGIDYDSYISKLGRRWQPAASASHPLRDMFTAN